VQFGVLVGAISAVVLAVTDIGFKYAFLILTSEKWIKEIDYIIYLLLYALAEKERPMLDFSMYLLFRKDNRYNY